MITACARAIAVVAAVALAAGCEPPTPRVDVLFGDCSPSFRERSQKYVDPMVSVAEDSARRDNVLYAGCFDGAPLKTLEWAIEADFEAVGEAAGGSSTGDAFKVAYARQLKGDVEAMLKWRGAPGSGQLAALELAAGIPGLDRVWLFTDGIVRRTANVDLENATRADLEAAAEEWAGRYGDGLEGVTVTFVGGGLGAPHSDVARNARLLFELVAADAGAELVWSRTSPFPHGGSG